MDLYLSATLSMVIYGEKQILGEKAKEYYFYSFSYLEQSTYALREK